MVMRFMRILVVGLFALFLNACIGNNIGIVDEPADPLPTAAFTMSELLTGLSDSDYRVRLTSVYALADMGVDAAPAVPALTSALLDDRLIVRSSAIDALGEIGPSAASAVPMLVQVLNSDEGDYESERIAAAKALGEINDTCAVPSLANVLFDQNTSEWLRGSAARAIARLTGISFPGELGTNGYILNDEGEALLVVAAKEWWLDKGQYQQWPIIESE